MGTTDGPATRTRGQLSRQGEQYGSHTGQVEDARDELPQEAQSRTEDREYMTDRLGAEECASRSADPEFFVNGGIDGRACIGHRGRIES